MCILLERDIQARMQLAQGIREEIQLIRGGKQDSAMGFLLIEIITEEYIDHPRELPREDHASPPHEPPAQ